MLQDEIAKTFGGKVRVRACGILIENNQILLIKHLGVGPEGYLWAPPGGGVELGESIKDTVKREFLEETGLEVSVGEFLFFHEFINLPLHSVELFFKVKKIGGKLKKGTDPEISEVDLIEAIEFKSIEDIKRNPVYYHSLLLKLNNF